jgi:hypothetical protein
MKSNILIEKMTQVSWFLFTRMKNVYIYGKGMDLLDSFYQMPLINHSVHLGLCIASVFCVSNLFKL